MGAIWDDCDCGRFPNSCESALRAQLFRCDLLWIGRAGIGLRHGRRNSRSTTNLAKRGRLGRRTFRSALHRSNPYFVSSDTEKRYQRAARHRASRKPNGCQGWHGMDHRAFRIYAQHLHRRHWLGLAGRIGAYTVRRWTGLLHAIMDGEGSSSIRDSVCRPHCACDGFNVSGDNEFCSWRCAGNLSEAFIIGCCLAVGSVSLHVRRAAQTCDGQGFREGTLS